MSKPEELIIDILIKEQKPFAREVTYSNLKYQGNQLRYDFLIGEEDPILLEFDGEQHFQWIKFFCKTQKDFQHLKENDRRKNRYAIVNNIPLYRIPYWDLDSIKTFGDLIQWKYRVTRESHNDIIFNMRNSK